MEIIQNIYPVFPKVAYPKVGDEVHWERSHCFLLIRDSDGKRVFATAPVDWDGNLCSNGQPPRLTGIIARVKIKGWVLEIK